MFDFKSLTTAQNCQQAVEETLKNKYDLILMDLEMPIKDGLTAAKEIRNNQENPNQFTPIIALTANATNLMYRSWNEFIFNQTISCF